MTKNETLLANREKIINEIQTHNGNWAREVLRKDLRPKKSKDYFDLLEL